MRWSRFLLFHVRAALAPVPNLRAHQRPPFLHPRAGLLPCGFTRRARCATLKCVYKLSRAAPPSLPATYHLCASEPLVRSGAQMALSAVLCARAARALLIRPHVFAGAEYVDVASRVLRLFRDLSAALASDNLRHRALPELSDAAAGVRRKYC